MKCLILLFTFFLMSSILALDDFDERYKKFKNDYLNPFLRVRVPGTQANIEVREFIATTLRQSGWQVVYDTFTSSTPKGNIEFSNVMATFNPDARERLLFSCHFDSKYFPNPADEFIGASDSAVPCAMLLELGVSLSTLMNKNSSISLQLIFFDGEEAFVNWSATDSLYGSRHMAKFMQEHTLNVPCNDTQLTMLNTIKVFVLLDLIADCRPNFGNYFAETEHFYSELVEIEKFLYKNGILSKNAKPGYFYDTDTNSYSNFYYNGLLIEDDHIPFLKENVPIVHLIPYPFPDYWHTTLDNESIICPNAVVDLLEIFRYFIRHHLNIL